MRTGCIIPAVLFVIINSLGTPAKAFAICDRGRCLAAVDPPAVTDRTDASAPDPGLRARTWYASAFQGFSRFSSDRPAWYDGAVIVGMKHTAGRATFVEIGRTSRHAETDLLLAIDHYQPFGSRSYANVRLALAAGGDVVPATDLYLEAFRGVPVGHEVSAGYRFARFDERHVHTFSAGLAKYVGNWYFRLKNSATPIDGSLGYAILFTVRRYGVSADEFVGATMAAGREIVGGPSGRTLIRSPYSASIYGQRYITANAGLKLSVDAVRDGNLSRWGVTVGAVFRW
ncbi:MAG: YaiO family outer membrane beta-barrel protein [Rhodothermales bacterium]|nr:YaiO family outer membrane beta-barrel protein [Rhodothermales bacterium]